MAVTDPAPLSYRLVRQHAGASVPPSLDPEQRRVVEHEGGPLLVLAGPGTGKTTTLVEAIVDRVRRGVSPDRILALTFSRKAAEQLRDRVTGRLGLTTSHTLSCTFHSFAYGVVRRYTPAELYDEPLRLLSAPEQDVVLQQILTTAPESVVWPQAIRGALGTRGFAAEVAEVLARAQEKGLGFEALHRLGATEQVPEFVAAAAFMAQYDTVMASQNYLDYPGLIATAVRLLQDPDQPVREELRAQYPHVFVDEYQDTDPAQVALLSGLAGDGRDLVVVGDPHQSIYAFRGAQVRGILEFPDRFRTAAGDPAPTVVLATTRRFGARIVRAVSAVAARLPLPGGISAEAAHALAHPATDRADPGRVELLTFDTDRAEAEHLADLLRRAHLHDGVPWSDMAVVVRSGQTTLPGLRRALTVAGVPVEVASDDTPLVREPAVAPLLEALHAVIGHTVTDPHHRAYVDPRRAQALLTSPLAGLDAVDVRGVQRRLRARERARRGDQPPRSSPELLREAVFDTDLLTGVPDPTPAELKTLALATLLRNARHSLDGGASIEDVLWALWDGTDWPARLRAAVARGGSAARLAHRELDAICALFEVAAKIEDQRGHTSAAAFLDMLTAQRIPADSLAERGIRGEAVRLLTAHRAKGLQWPLVVVAHVQEDTWPDLRRRATLLGADRIGREGLLPSRSTRDLLADERRLFYVACTRACDRLVVTAVASTDEDGEQPSRFLQELFPDHPDHRIQHRPGRPARPLSMPGLVAELRRTLADETQPSPLRTAAALRLARLTAAHRRHEVWAPMADPATWWGTRDWTVSAVPVAPTDRPVVLTASTLTGLEGCPARWFLEREAGGATVSTQAQGFGNVVHALADRIGRGEEPVTPDLVDRLMGEVDRVWPRIPFRTPWSGDGERAAARDALTRFLAHHQRPDAREVIGTEQALRADLRLPDGTEIRLTGYADRLELDGDGRVVVVDLKTGKSVPTQSEVAIHPQLGFYQLAVEHGAVPGHAETGGAELWHLRSEASGRMRVQAQSPQQPDGDGLRAIDRQLATAAAALRDERFPARPHNDCHRCPFVRSCPAHHAGTVLS